MILTSSRKTRFLVSLEYAFERIVDGGKRQHFDQVTMLVIWLFVISKLQPFRNYNLMDGK